MRVLFIALTTAMLTTAACTSADAAGSKVVPPPAMDIPAPAGLQTAVLAGGCFWGMEGVYEHVKGVKNVVSGYAGGAASDATYDKVSTERTGHAEAVRITYDPKQVTYGTLLQIYFSVAHDPTQLNRQGPDSGPSYRSAIFPQTPDQVRVAHAYLKQLTAARAFGRPIVTKLESGKFYDAERSHQDFMRRNPMHPYILANDVGKVSALRRMMPSLYRG
ncbi:peptide-methionine (S)-S-oxide reductase MsrA [Sphingomonas sp.]|uniref:peptide-methionine (S)-S-oxide reductase MsrA n=1 Tax=Sphingomonas sp. TaxID=28214 RepID=UPI00386C35EC